MPLSIENFETFAGHSVRSLLKYTFNDTASQKYALPSDTDDFCGEKLLTFTINGTTTELLTANNSDYIYFNPPADFTDFGIG